MLAVGPIAVLPSPLLAAIPLVSDITVTSGSATITPGVNNLNVSATSDRTVLVWGATKFNLAPTETYNFSLPNSNSAVLNKVGYNTNGTLATADTATINGTLISNGKVFVLANGNIVLGGQASITTQSGLVLSTLQTANDNSFTGSGTIPFNGTALGDITIGNATGSPATITGGLEAWGSSILVNAVQVNSGATILRTVTSGANITLGDRGNAQFLGNLTAITTNGNIIGNSTGGGGVYAGNATLQSGTANITLSNVTSDFGNVSISSSNGSNVTLADANNITVLGSTLGNLSITANNAITASGNVVASSNVTLASAVAGDINWGNSSVVGGTFNASTNAGNITTNTAGNLTVGAVTATAALSSVSLNTANTLNLGDITLTGANGTLALSAGSINATGTSDITGGSGLSVTQNATTGSVVLGNVNASKLTVNTNNGAISQAAGTNLTLTSSTQNITAGTGNITLNSPTNNLGGSVLNLVGSSATVVTNSTVTIASANLTNNLTINTAVPTSAAGGGAVTLGQGGGSNAPVINVGGGMSITTNASTITDDPDLTLRVFGATNLNTVAGATGQTTGGAAVTLTAAQTRGIANLGQLSIYVGNSSATISETTTINIGQAVMANASAASTGGVLTLNSTQGSILFAGGNISVGSVSANANTGNITQTSGITLLGNATSTLRAAAAGNIILDSNGNNFGNSTLSVTNNATTLLQSGSGFTFTGAGMNGTNVTVTLRNTGSGAINLAGGNVTNLIAESGGTIAITGNMDNFRNLTLTSNDTGANSISQTARLTSNGTVTLSSAGNIALGNATNNLTGSQVLSNVAGDVALSSSRNLTISGATLGNLTANAGTNGGSFENPWVLTFGNLNVRNLLANVSNGAGNAQIAGNSGEIRQAAGSSLHVESSTSLISYNGNIVLGNNGNSFGRIDAATGGSAGVAGNGSISIVEDGGLRVGNIATSVSANLTSRFGSVLEDNNADVVVLVNGTNSVLSLNAPNGSVLLGNTTHTLGNTTANITGISIAASGAAAITSLGNLTLGAMSVNSLTASSGNNIAQSGALNVFGPSSFTAAGNITLTDAANNFGPVLVNSTGSNKNIAITEANTLNLRSVSMVGGGNGTFTATSTTGDIIDSGVSGVRAGGTIGASGTGLVTLSAVNGNITIDDATSDFPTTAGVVFNGKNVTLQVLGNSTLVLGNNTTTSVATGNLTTRSFLGNIENNGALNVADTATFEAGPTGNVTVKNANNRFGTVKFNGNEIRISQVNDMNIATGSSAIGLAELDSTGSYVTIANVGGGVVTFGNTVTINSASSITLPKLVQAVGTLTVNAPGTKDLSALSISSDLSGKDPVNQGTGTYVAPQP